jgi:hypothetical protein
MALDQALKMRNLAAQSFQLIRHILLGRLPFVAHDLLALSPD